MDEFVNEWIPEKGKIYNLECQRIGEIISGKILLPVVCINTGNDYTVKCSYPCLVSKMEAAVKSGKIPPFFARVIYTGDNKKGELLFKVFVQ